MPDQQPAEILRPEQQAFKYIDQDTIENTAVERKQEHKKMNIEISHSARLAAG
jgi:hypothetical protein